MSRTKTNYTHLAFLVDQSGSMSSIKNDMIGGFETFIKDQKAEEGRATVSISTFNTIYQQQLVATDIQKVDTLMLRPMGGTALNDSIARMITETEDFVTKLKNSKKKAPRILFVIITDGEENASVEFGRYSNGTTKIKDLIERKTKENNWEFVYIGANVDSFTESKSRGMTNSMNFTSDSHGVNTMYSNISASVKSYRKGGDLDLDNQVVTTSVKAEDVKAPYSKGFNIRGRSFIVILASLFTFLFK